MFDEIKKKLPFLKTELISKSKSVYQKRNIQIGNMSDRIDSKIRVNTSYLKIKKAWIRLAVIVSVLFD